MNRIRQLQNLLVKLGTDALYLTHLPDVRWACGFTGSNGLLIVLPASAHFLTDGRYASQAAAEVSGADVHVAGYDLIGHLAEAPLLGGVTRAVYQSDHLSVSAWTELRERLPEVAWTGEEELLVRLVASKEAREIERIRAAQRLTEAVFEQLLTWIRPGLSERKIAAEIVCRHLKEGAERMSFEPIVASGPNSALPHARPTGRTLEKGDVVVLDMGGVLDGYASDMTRVVALGRPDAEAREVFELVLAAQERAIADARSGMASKDVDALARDVIREAGYGEAFSHSLGHGVGLQVHEWPRVSHAADYVLPPHCVVSIEPGVYLRDRFGIRIEDLVVLEEDGCRNLTQASKKWTIL
jgi:Xaa-Pro aminopeptidase